MDISLHDLAGGALQEKVNQAFEQVMKNMQDPNTPWKNKRKINLMENIQEYLEEQLDNLSGFTIIS